MKIKYLALAVAIGVGSTNIALASDTTSSIRGNLTSPAGQVVSNAKVEIVHIPSGTKVSTTTNSSGEFSSSGLRVGGPYTVTITSPEGAKTYENLFLSLGSSLRLAAQLEVDSVERIAVTGTSLTLASNTGASSFFGEEAIKNAPSFNRDLKDIVRNNPLVNVNGADGTISVAGTNPRFNKITVDGISMNDDFGLNMTGYPTTRSPISLDAIEQIIVDTSPFKAKDSGFQGAKINAVTKSGTNEVKGSFFYEFQNDSLAGKAPMASGGILNGKKESLDFDEKTFGATLGGAIVEDELFYFVSYEKFDGETSGWGPSGAEGFTNTTSATLEQYNELKRIASEVYGVDVGEYAVNPKTAEEKLLFKLDWNINDSQRAAFTYQYSDGNQINNTTEATTELRLASHWYDKQESLESYSFKLYSDWTSDFSSQLSLTYQDNATNQIPGTRAVGDVQIFPNHAADSSTSISFGADQSRHANDLGKKTIVMDWDADYLLDDHKISFGYNFKRLDIYNEFVQHSLGTWVFRSMADFELGNAYSFRYNNSPTLNPIDAAVSFVRDEHALYIHDEWAATESLVLDFGVRYERLASDDVPAINSSFVTATGYDNTENLDGLDIFLPRFGFKWDATEDLVVRGGAGRFSGGSPSVWSGNAYGKNGLTQVDTQSFTSSNARFGALLRGMDITQIPQEILDFVQSSDSTSEVNLNDPNFELPSDWRFQIATDYSLDIPYVVDDALWTVEYTYKKPENTAFWKDITIGNLVGTTPDGGRDLYQRPANTNHRSLMLTNADEEGRSHIVSTSLFSKWDNGISLNTSYTYSDITDVTVGTSSTASSNYGNNIAINRNEGYVGTSPFETKHRFLINLGYEVEFFAGYKTKFNSFFERRSGKVLSYLSFINGNSTGQNFTGRESSGGLVPYIAKAGDAAAGTVRYIGGTTEEQYLAFVDALGLSQYGGGYLPKGVSNSPWVTTWDVSIRQEIPGLIAEHKGEVYLTIDNFLNLVDSSKGHVFDTSFGSLSSFNYNIAADGVHELSLPAARFQQQAIQGYDRINDTESAWRLKVGVNYRF
jgi:hypothetical protein